MRRLARPGDPIEILHGDDAPGAEERRHLPKHLFGVRHIDEHQASVGKIKGRPREAARSRRALNELHILQTEFGNRAPRLPRYYGPIRHPPRPDLALAGCRLRSRPHRGGFPCSARSPCHACRRHYPGGTAWTLSLVLSSQRRPSPLSDRFGSHIILFEACSAFTPVTACMRAESPMRPFDVRVLQRDSLPPLTAPTASGWSDHLPGGTLTHWRSPSLHGAPDSRHKGGGIKHRFDIMSPSRLLPDQPSDPLNTVRTKGFSSARRTAKPVRAKRRRHSGRQKVAEAACCRLQRPLAAACRGVHGHSATPDRRPAVHAGHTVAGSLGASNPGSQGDNPGT